MTRALRLALLLAVAVACLAAFELDLDGEAYVAHMSAVGRPEEFAIAKVLQKSVEFEIPVEPAGVSGASL